MKPKTPGPILAAYGDPTASRLVVWYAGTNQDAVMEGGDCPDYLAAFLEAGCFVVRVAPTVEGPEGRQWTEETADAAMVQAALLWSYDGRGPRPYVVGFSNGTTGACWGSRHTTASGLALLCGSGLTQPVDPKVPVYLGFGSRDRKIDKATRIARAEAWRVHSTDVVVQTHDHGHEVSAAHLPEVLAAFGMVMP